MIKNQNNNRLFTRKTIKIILITPLLLLGLGILYIVAVYTTNPIFDRLNHDKFTKLDTQMQGLFQKLKTASGEDDIWKYITSCDVEMSGDWPTGEYYCTALISTEKEISSIQEFNTLQTKYYPTINSSNTLKQTSELETEPLNNFGNNFVVSSAEKTYIEVKSKIKCNYSIELNQKNEDSNLISSAYGSDINNHIGNANIRLSCGAIARGYWYNISNPAQLPSPDSPLKQP